MLGRVHEQQVDLSVVRWSEVDARVRRSALEWELIHAIAVGITLHGRVQPFDRHGVFVVGAVGAIPVDGRRAGHRVGDGLRSCGRIRPPRLRHFGDLIDDAVSRAVGGGFADAGSAGRFLDEFDVRAGTRRTRHLGDVRVVRRRGGPGSALGLNAVIVHDRAAADRCGARRDVLRHLERGRAVMALRLRERSGVGERRAGPRK